MKYAKILHSNGASLDRKVGDYSPLIVSSQYNHCNIINYLLTKGANIEQTGEYGETSLHMAIQRGSFAAVQLLCERGANIEHLTVNGLSPLFSACIRGHQQQALDIVKYLVSKVMLFLQNPMMQLNNFFGKIRSSTAHN